MGIIRRIGEVAERLKAAVLKTVEGYPPSQGSNPCLSAIFRYLLLEKSLIRVLIVDDHNLVREGIQSMLYGAQGIKVVGEATDGEEAVKPVSYTHLTLPTN